MKAMILAAGLGTRMRPLTLLRAKPVLPVLNRPLLHWTLEHLARHGVDDVVVNLHHLPDTVSEALEEWPRSAMRLRYSREGRILGTAGGPRAVRDLFGDEPFLLINGDMLFDFDVGRARGASSRLGGQRHSRAPAQSRSQVVRSGRHGRERARPLPCRSAPARAGNRVRSSPGYTCSIPVLLDRLPAGASDSVLDLYAPMVAEGERVQGVRRGARGTTSAARRSTGTHSCAAAGAGP